MGRRRWWGRKEGGEEQFDDRSLPVEMTTTTEVVDQEEVTTVRYEIAGHDVGMTLTITAPAPDTTRYVAYDWPRSAPDPTGPATPPPEALAVAPDLAEVLRVVPEPELPQPRRDDWPVNATLAQLRMVDADEWTDADTEHVRAAITDDVDAYMRSLIDRWRGLWWQLTWQSKFQARFPAFVASLAERHRTDPRYARKKDAHGRSGFSMPVPSGCGTFTACATRGPTTRRRTVLSAGDGFRRSRCGDLNSALVRRSPASPASAARCSVTSWRQSTSEGC